jgi:hypothetical protein
MHMGIDQAGQDDFVPGVKYLPGLIGIDFGFHPLDAARCQRDIETAIAPVGGIDQVSVSISKSNCFIRSSPLLPLPNFAM